MKFVSLTLTNVFQHTELRHEFSPGITGIVGRNGSGKSNFLEALYFALSGKTSADTVKADMVGWGASTGSTVFDFEHGGDSFTLQRRIDSSSVLLTSPSLDKPLRGKEANAFVEDALGTSFSGMYETCFTPQGGLISVLTMGHSQRMALFQRLVRHATVERIRGKLSEAKNRIPLYLDRSDEIKGLRTLIDEQLAVKAAADTWAARSSSLEAEYSEKLPSVRATLALPTEEDRLKLISEAEARYAAAQEAVLRAQSQQSVEDCPACDPPTEAEENLAKLRMSFDDMTAKLEEESNVVAQCCADLQSLAEVLDPTPLQDQITSLTADLSRLQAAKDLYEAGECPTCLRKYEAYQADLDQVIVSIHQAQLELDAVKQDSRNKAEAYKQYCKARTLLQTRESVAAEAHAALLDHISNVPDAAKVFDLDAYMQNKDAYARFARYLQLKARAEATMQPYQLALVEAEDALQKANGLETCSQDAQKQCKEFLAAFEDIRERRIAAIADSARAEATIASSKTRLVQAENEQAQRKSSEAIWAFLEDARGVLHRDNLPKLAMQKILVGLNAQLDSYLSLFDTNFTAHINEEFDFMVSFSSKRTVSARALSGGQKVALALAFKFAAADLLAFQVPILVLDEPTVWLDDINKPKLASILAKAKSITERTSSEVLIATHEPLLMPAFSRIKDVSESGAYSAIS
jgi:DNA repair exonuclease SbcCD ATPase subunit